MNKNKTLQLASSECFGKDDWIEYDFFDFFTVIVGKNNAGKSYLTSLIESIYLPFFKAKTTQNLSTTIKAKNCKARMNVLLREGDFGNQNETIMDSSGDEYRPPLNIDGRKATIDFSFAGSEKPTIICSSIDGDDNWRTNLQPPSGDYFAYHFFSTVEKHLSDFFNVNHFVRLDAERDIVPEKTSKSKPQIQKNGSGATSLLEWRLQSKEGNESLVDEKVLGPLNEICGNDAGFEKLRVKRDTTNDVNEVFLTESGQKEGVSINNMGSGLKTIILVLLALMENEEQETVFCFEELENNLHPSVQRRLFDYLYQYAKEHHCYFIITTHSNVPINLFFANLGVQVLHVWRSNCVSHAETLTCNSDVRSTLEDLGIKASDIMQANGVIWVEGPSDRIYIEKWLKLYRDILINGKDVAKVDKEFPLFKEGIDYSYIYTGGANLANLDADAEKDGIDNLIDILKINRNAFIVMDSDKNSSETQISKTKERILNELTQDKCWITQGRDIENYLKQDTVKKLYPSFDLAGKNEFFDFGKSIEPFYKSFESTKRVFAERISALFEDDDINNFDLKAKIESLYQAIKSWNDPAYKPHK